MHKAIEFLFPMNAVGWLPSTEYVSEYDQSIRVYHLGAVFTPIGLGRKEMGPLPQLLNGSLTLAMWCEYP